MLTQQQQIFLQWLLAYEKKPIACVVRKQQLNELRLGNLTRIRGLDVFPGVSKIRCI